MPPSKNVLTIKAKDSVKVARRMATKGKQATIKVQSVGGSYMENLTRDQEHMLRQQTAILMEPGKGIIAVDSSVNTIDNCLRSMKLGGTEHNRARYLDVLLGDRSELRHYVTGILMNEELSKLKIHKGRCPAVLLQEVRIQMGIRVDAKFVKIPGTCGEWASLGLDTINEDCRRFKDRGATFVLWRCVYKVTTWTPSTLALTVNSNTLARFASHSQAAGLVPILSAELIPDGDYNLHLAHGALRNVLSSLVTSLQMYRVYLEALIIRLTPAFPGLNYTEKFKLSDVVLATLQTCNSRIPPAVGGIMLCRRETLEDSVEILNELNKYPMKKPHAISFCYSRVIHDDVIKIWAGQDGALPKARNILLERAKMCSLGSMGQYPERDQSLFISDISNQ